MFFSFSACTPSVGNIESVSSNSEIKNVNVPADLAGAIPEYEESGRYLAIKLKDSKIEIPYYGNATNNTIKAIVYKVDEKSFKNLDTGTWAAFEGFVPHDHFSVFSEVINSNFEVLTRFENKDETKPYLVVKLPLKEAGYYYVELADSAILDLPSEKGMHWLLFAW